MPLAKIDGRYPACIRYPKSRIDYQQDGDMLILLIPPLLCVELFRSGVLPSKNELPKAVSIKISGKKIGDFRLFEIQYPSNYDSDRIRLKMTKRQIDSITRLWIGKKEIGHTLEIKTDTTKLACKEKIDSESAIHLMIKYFHGDLDWIYQYSWEKSISQKFFENIKRLVRQKSKPKHNA